MEENGQIPYGTIAMCAQDFISALSERPKVLRLCLRFIFGEKAYHEFILLTDAFIKSEMYNVYECDDMEYHKKEYRNDFSEGLRKY